MRRRPVNSKTKVGERVVVGIDPDLNHTGLCVIGEGEVLDAVLVKPIDLDPRFGDLRYRMARALALELEDIFANFGPDLVVIEWQAIRPSDPRPNDILELCSVAGVALGLCARKGILVERPLPVAWKGSVPKKIHQPKILTAAGLSVDSVPFEGIPRGKLNHVIDALGLAIWGSQ
ncbi:hypothetical protein LCGC14_1744230 [marine sediment metagenome]|uniref:Holliday junction nuclease RuvC n=1 Tax=marine sediment metagenome TaxID=412755 RepID=A0A0F9HTF6_9ZZZZ